MQIQISWLFQKPTDLDLHCLQRQVYPGSAGQGLNWVLMESLLHRFVNLMKGDYYAYVGLRKLNIILVG